MNAPNPYSVTQNCGHAAGLGLRCWIANCRTDQMSNGDGNASVAIRVVSLCPGR